MATKLDIVPSKGLAFLSGLAQGLAAEVQRKKEMELAQQKMQADMWKTMFPQQQENIRHGRDIQLKLGELAQKGQEFQMTMAFNMQKFQDEIAMKAMEIEQSWKISQAEIKSDEDLEAAREAHEIKMQDMSNTWDLAKTNFLQSMENKRQELEIESRERISGGQIASAEKIAGMETEAKERISTAERDTRLEIAKLNATTKVETTKIANASKEPEVKQAIDAWGDAQDNVNKLMLIYANPDAKEAVAETLRIALEQADAAWLETKRLKDEGKDIVLGARPYELVSEEVKRRFLPGKKMETILKPKSAQTKQLGPQEPANNAEMQSLIDGFIERDIRFISPKAQEILRREGYTDAEIERIREAIK